jgi:hypothetical protein
MAALPGLAERHLSVLDRPHGDAAHKVTPDQQAQDDRGHRSYYRSSYFASEQMSDVG